MKVRILRAWDAVRGSFWFVPLLLAVGAVALAFGMLALDHGAGGRWVERHGLGYGGSAEGAATVMQAIASSMITIAGVVFSMTLVALSLAGSQLGPRLLRSYMRDRSNQAVLGVFVATFLYGILVLRAVRRADENLFVPHLSVALGVVLAAASLCVLVYFIHHVATTMQADHVIARVAGELDEGIDRMFPGREATPQGAAFAAPPPAERGRPVAAGTDGYVQLVDVDALAEAATQADAVVVLRCRPGDFRVAGAVLAVLHPAGRADDALAGRVAQAFVLGPARTAVQDVAFPMQQLVEVALRAISPGINDPFTAVACIHRIGAALARVAGRELPARWRGGADGVPRVHAEPHTFASLAAAALDPIRRHGHDIPLVTTALIDMLEGIAPQLRRDEDRACARDHLERTVRVALAAATDEVERRTVERACEAALAALDGTAYRARGDGIPKSDRASPASRWGT